MLKQQKSTSGAEIHLTVLAGRTCVKVNEVTLTAAVAASSPAAIDDVKTTTRTIIMTATV